MKPLIFLGQTFAHDKDFKRAFPAYREYVALVRAGNDTPQKVETALYRMPRRARRSVARKHRKQA